MNEKAINTLEFYKIKEFLKDEAVTYLGKELLDKLMPVSDINKIKEWQAEVEEAASTLLRKYNLPLANITDISNILVKLKIGAILNPKEILEILDILKVSRRLKNYLTDNNIELKCLNIYFENLYTNKNLEEEIERCIKSEEEIDDHASKELYNIRRKIVNLEIQIKEKLNDIIHSNSKMLQDDVITFRNGRYVIPVKQEYKNEISGLMHDYSSTGNTVFIEPSVVFNKNNEIQELKNQEKIEIDRILALLTQMIFPLTTQLESSLKNIGSIDSIFAKAKYGLSIDGFMPILNTNNYINLKKARHPLIDKASVVPIDVWIGDKFNTLVVTGPNTGGKTVTLKTVGLLTIMAQCGLLIPANENSEIAIFNDIYTDIGDEQSIEQSLSTFSAHMTNIVKIIKEVKNVDLVLLDELGSGTDPVEGAALAMAILDYLHFMGVSTFATTHYSELKTYAIKTEGVENASCEFNIETLRPTYRLLIGLPGKSNAFAISKRLGLLDSIISKANSYVSSESIRFEDVIGDIEENMRNAREERELSKRMLYEANETKRKIDDEAKKLEDKKETIILKAKEKARDILLDAKEEANDIIKELTLLKNQREKDDTNRRAEENRKKLNKSISDIQKDLMIPDKQAKEKVKSEDVKIGKVFYVPSLDQEVTIVSNIDKKGNVMVQSGIVKLSIHFSKLEKVDSDKAKNRVVVNSYVKSKSQTTSSEINLIGNTVEEATEKLDKYIDDAYLAGIGQVRIVHGKGSGALRTGVQNYLKNNSHVKSYRLGVFGEGDTGVTIVELK